MLKSEFFNILYINVRHEDVKEIQKMITLTPSKSELAGKTNNANKPTGAVETAGSLAMLFDNGLMTMGMYDSFVSSNPFVVNYSNYSEGTDASIACNGGFLSDFSNAVSAIGSGETNGSTASSGAMGGSFSGGSCGSFTSVC